jgi:hypothetical protein
MGPEASTATVSWLPTTYTWSKRFSGLQSLLVSPNLSSATVIRGVIPFDGEQSRDVDDRDDRFASAAQKRRGFRNKRNSESGGRWWPVP